MSEELDPAILAEYQHAIERARSSHGELKKWILYAGEQLEMAGFEKEKISSRLKKDLPEISESYIREICATNGWTDPNYARNTDGELAPEAALQNSSTSDNQINSFIEENKPYIYHLQRKIELLREVQKRMGEIHFLSLLDKKQYEEYTFLADKAEELARQAWDGRQMIPVATQFYLTQIVAISTIKHGACEYIAKVKDIAGLTSKQVTKTLKGITRDVHPLYEPGTQLEALMDGFYGKPCEECGSWRVRWENGTCWCYHCEHEYRVKAEKLLLARETNWSN